MTARSLIAGSALLVAALAASPAAAQPCPGDCNADCAVSVDEIVTLVGIGVGSLPPDACRAGDADGDGVVTVDEIVGALNAALAGCDGPTCNPLDARCRIAAGSGVSFDPDEPACERLSSYRIFVGDPREQRPNRGVVPYDLNTELWTDGARKHRFVWLPPGTAAAFDPNDAFDFPVGTVLVKTFAFPVDERAPELGEDLLETRLLVRRSDGWVGLPYVWNEEETEARLRITGATLPVASIDAAGEPFAVTYEVPNTNQCKTCHAEDGTATAPLGPKARHLNKTYAYDDGAANQLEHWAELGILTGLPGPAATLPRSASLADSRNWSVEERARTYLDVNCAHCHNARGTARPTGVHLGTFEADPLRLGLCKNPTAAGQGTGGLPHVVDPGAPDNSVLVFRVESTDPILRMPELGRSRVHDEAVSVLRAWIAAMDGDCTFPVAAGATR